MHAVVVSAIAVFKQRWSAVAQWKQAYVFRSGEELNRDDG